MTITKQLAYCTRVVTVVTVQYTYKTWEQFKLFYLTLFFFFYFYASKYFLDAYQAHQMNIFWHQDQMQKGLSDISTAGYVLKEIKRSRVEHVHFIGSKKHYLFCFQNTYVILVHPFTMLDQLMLSYAMFMYYYVQNDSLSTKLLKKYRITKKKSFDMRYDEFLSYYFGFIRMTFQ